MKNSSLLIGFSLIFMLLSFAAYAIQTIQLENRTAAEIIPTIKPLLKKTDAITGSDYKLFIRTDQKTLNSIMPIIKQLDKKRASLMISIESKRQNEFNSHSLELQAHPDPNIRANTRSTHKTTSHYPKVRTLENTRTFIYTGTVSARPIRQISRLNDQLIEQELSPYQQTRSGFYATPRIVNNNEIIIDIEPQQQSIALDGTHNQFSLNTSVRGKLEEWISLGEVNKQSAEGKNTLSTHAQNAERRIQTDNRDALFIKVDRLD